MNHPLTPTARSFWVRLLVAVGVFFLFWIAIVVGWVRIAALTGFIIAGAMALGILVSIISNFDGFLQFFGVGALFLIVCNVISLSRNLPCCIIKAPEITLL